MAGQRKDHWNTLSGIDITPKSGPSDAESAGQPPYTRGIHDTMYRSRLWTMRQYAGFSSAHTKVGKSRPAEMQFDVTDVRKVSNCA